ncbi:MAG TPA: type II toxin-antitoxin system PemK/MazF family toxin [Bacillota bacterium]|nr:type II toxin-antitoxin system PemK/MazF family toxin [Bacillota bacterium]
MTKYQWKIFWANLNPATGSEQAGKRPVLVVSTEEVNQALPIVTVLPLTSARPLRKIYPTEVFLSKDLSGLTKDSIAMVHQIRTVSKERLEKVCGAVTDEKLQEQVRLVLKRYFAI